MSNDFLFASDESPATPLPDRSDTDNPDPQSPPWLVLVADDEPEVHAVTRLALARLRFRGRPVRLLDCASAAEAERILRETPGIAVILLDVVMETEDAGLRLVRTIREDLGNRAVRIVLRTGQPARIPEEELVLAYEIDGYTAKTELTARRLFTSVVTALRAYAAFEALERQLAERTRALEEATVRLNRLAVLDPLTGVWNRRRCLELAATELAATVPPAPRRRTASARPTDDGTSSWSTATSSSRTPPPSWSISPTAMTIPACGTRRRRRRRHGYSAGCRSHPATCASGRPWRAS